ncbi:hypothetical protein [Enterococcus florum]|nr:hypothetical protein [Enterococcus florum]
MESFSYRGLKITPVQTKWMLKELASYMTFEGAITYERLKEDEFNYYLMPKRDLLQLLERVAPSNQEPVIVYRVEGTLVTNHLKNEEIRGEYLATRWGFLQLVCKE